MDRVNNLKKIKIENEVRLLTLIAGLPEEVKNYLCYQVISATYKFPTEGEGEKQNIANLIYADYDEEFNQYAYKKGGERVPEGLLVGVEVKKDNKWSLLLMKDLYYYFSKEY